MENDADEILPRIWLGNYKSSINSDFLHTNNINYVISITKTNDDLCENIFYLIVPKSDHELCSTENTILENILLHIKYVINNTKSSILINCKKGHHRSASIILAYMIKNLNIDYYDAVNYIKNIRPRALRRQTCMLDNVIQYICR